MARWKVPTSLDVLGVAVITALAVVAPASAHHLPPVLPLEPLSDHTHEDHTGFQGPGINLFGMVAAGASFAEADLSGADLRYADLTDVNFTGADLTGADLRNSICNGANFDGATLSGARLQSAIGRKATFRAAVMEDVNLSNATLTGADFADANLRDVAAVNASLGGASFDGATLLFGELSYADLTGASFVDSDAAATTFERADLTGATLTGGRFFAANFLLTTLDEVVAKRADMRLIRLRDATCCGIDLEYAQLDQANLFATNLLGADLSGADLRNAELLDLAISDSTTRYRCDTVLDGTGVDPMAAGWTLEPPPTPPIVYVDGSRPGGCGSSWDQAFATLDEAILAVRLAGGDIEEVWVAQGVYRPVPGPGDPRFASFVIPDGARLYGGFVGTETDRDQRDPLAHLTLLSGDLNGDDEVGGSRADNCYQVVSTRNSGPATLLDGFTISGGNAVGSPPHERGGGIYLEFSWARIESCTVRDNAASIGGGIAALLGGPTIVSSQVIENTAVEPSSFAGGFGAGVALLGADGRIVSTIIARNAIDAGVDGMGSAVFASSTAAAELINVTIVDNVVPDGDAGPVEAVEFASVTIENAILWNNDGLAAQATPSAAVTLSRSIVEGGWPGDLVIAEDPRFLPGDPTYRVTELSPAIDGGNTPALGADDELDARLHARVVDDVGVSGEGIPDETGVIVDLGAVEFTGMSPDICLPDVNADGQVGIDDLIEMLSMWGPCDGCAADLTGDGAVNITDLLLLLSAWGLCG